MSDKIKKSEVFFGDDHTVMECVGLAASAGKKWYAEADSPLAGVRSIFDGKFVCAVSDLEDDAQ